jgi:hypothetical protein
MDLPLHSVIQIKLWLQRYMHLSPLSLLFTNIRATNILIYGQVYPARETNVLNVRGRDFAASIIGPPSEYISSLLIPISYFSKFTNETIYICDGYFFFELHDVECWHVLLCLAK